MKVIHSYEKKNLKKLRRNDEADCTKCAFAEKTPDIEGGYVYLCHAALYDIETLSCFVPKPDNQKSTLPWYMSLFNPNIFSQKVWRGEWEFPIFKDEDANDPRCKCSECGSVETPLARHRFCPNCGAPMTDEAVQMVMERLEALHETT